MQRFLPLILFIPLFFPSLVMAESQSLALSATPVFSLVSLAPGSSVKRSITLTNTSAAALNITVETHGFAASDDKGGSEYPDTKGGAQHWFNFSPSVFSLPSHSSRDVVATISAPKDATSGGQYASVFFIASPPQDNSVSTQINFSARVGTFFFMTVGGNLHSEGQITQFATKSFWQDQPVRLQLTAHNYGNVHIKPHSVLSIKDFWGHPVLQQIDPGVYVLPARSRTWQVVLDRTLLPGYYQATLASKITPSSRSVSQTVRFWVMPWALLAVILMLALGSAIIMLRQMSHLHTQGQGTHRKKFIHWNLMLQSAADKARRLLRSFK